MSGANDSPMIPDIPHPSSSTVEHESRMPCLKSRFEEVIQEANRGVIFQTTWATQSRMAGFMRKYLPAPVVPPPRFEDNIVGDWWMVRSRPLIVNSNNVSLGSTKPRSWEGIDCEKRMNDSMKRHLAHEIIVKEVITWKYLLQDRRFRLLVYQAMAASW